MKYLDYQDWVKIAFLVRDKMHLTQEGIDQIKLIYSGMNSKRLYPSNYQPAHCIIEDPSYIPLDGNYISGFFAGDGSLSMVSDLNSPYFGNLYFSFGQHFNNLLLLQSFAPFFNLSSAPIHKKKKTSIIEFRITDRQLLSNNMIPFFNLYPLYGVKTYCSAQSCW